jgi:hypothetical protein
MIRTADGENFPHLGGRDYRSRKIYRRPAALETVWSFNSAFMARKALARVPACYKGHQPKSQSSESHCTNRMVFDF